MDYPEESSSWGHPRLLPLYMAKEMSIGMSILRHIHYPWLPLSIEMCIGDVTWMQRMIANIILVIRP